jgi:hypothetical protein
MECDYHINTVFVRQYKGLTSGNQAEGGRSRITSLPQQLCDNTSAEQTNSRITLLVQMLTEWSGFISTCIVLQCLNMSPNSAIYLQTPSGHTSAAPIS